jgi:ankyrin repeat protein
MREEWPADAHRIAHHAVQATLRNPNQQLEKAVEEGRASAIAALVRAGADANTADAQGRSLLFQAAERGDAATVQALVAAGARVGARNKAQATPLHAAAAANQVAAVGALLGAGAEVDARDRRGQTPAHAAAFLGKADALCALLRAGAAVHAADADGQTPLHKAAWMQEGRSPACVEALVGAGADLEGVDAAGETPLHKAAFRGGVPALAALLAAGADPSTKVGRPAELGRAGAATKLCCGDSAGLTALQLAERHRRAAAVQLLAEAEVRVIMFWLTSL